MKQLMTYFTITILSVVLLRSGEFDTRNMTIRINGNPHIVHDFISEEIHNLYLAKREDMRIEIHNKTYAEEGITGVEVFMPEDLSSLKFTSAANSLSLEIRINDVRDNFNKWKSRFDTKFDIVITADVEIKPKDLEYVIKIKNANAYATNLRIPHCNPVGICNAEIYAIKLGWLYKSIVGDLMTTPIMNKDYPIYKHGHASTMNSTPEQIEEARNSFPMDFSVSGGGNNSLVIDILCMKGTLLEPIKFINTSPSAVTDQSFDYLGFNLSGKSLDSAFSTFSSNLPGVPGSMQVIDLITQGIKQYGGQSVVMDFNWYKIAHNLFKNRPGGFDPNTLTGAALKSEVDNLLEHGDWAKTDAMMNLLQNNSLDVIGQLGGIGNYDDNAGHISKMAPDNGTPRFADGVNYVSPATYLYFQKILAHAVVEKYHDKIGIWLIEAELNAAKLNTWWSVFSA